MAVTAECTVVTGHLLDVCKTDRVNVWRNSTMQSMTGLLYVSFLVERMLCFASETLSSVRCVAHHVGR